MDRLTAGYLPNAPALSWRRSGVIKGAGRSDFNQCLPLFDALDEAFSSWMRGIMREILRKAGFSPSSWGDPDQSGGQATATEIQARTEQTERTRSRKNLHDRRVLSRMGSVALELDGILFPGKGGGRHDLNVVFPELSRTDPKTEAETIGLLKVAGAISTEAAVRRANPDWDDAAISEEVERIQRTQDSEQSPDPFTIDRVDNDADPEE